jgi:fumarate hydratase subunit beta
MPCTPAYRDQHLGDYANLQLQFAYPSFRYPQLSVGDKLLLSGELITARDAAHRRIVNAYAMESGCLSNCETSRCFTAAQSGGTWKTCGAIGPTTSSRMDSYLPLLIEHGLRLSIGKGDRSPEAEAD